MFSVDFFDVLVSWSRLQSFHEKVSVVFFPHFVKTSWRFWFITWSNTTIKVWFHWQALVEHLFDTDTLKWRCWNNVTVFQKRFCNELIRICLTSVNFNFKICGSVFFSLVCGFYHAHVVDGRTRKRPLFILESLATCWRNHSSKQTFYHRPTKFRSTLQFWSYLMIFSWVSKVWYRFKFSTCNKWVLLLTWKI